MARGGLRISIGPEIDEWKKWVLAFDGELKIGAEKGTKKAVQFVIAEIQNRIRAGRYRKLSPLTRMMRTLEGYSTTPLLRRGALVRSITGDVETAWKASVGLLSTFGSQRGRDPTTGKFKKGEQRESNLGRLLHDGGLIKVTDKMRQAFARRMKRAALKNNASLLPPQKKGKGYIKIPPRPFIKDVFDDPAVMKKIEEIYYQEIGKQAGLL